MPTTRTVTVRPDGTGTPDYTSMVAAEAGEQGDIVASDEIVDFVCGGASADVGDVVFAGWTCDDTRFVRMSIAAGEEPDGIGIDTATYRLQGDAAIAAIRIEGSPTNLEMIGIQVQDTGGTSSGFTYGIQLAGGAGAGWLHMERCYVSCEVASNRQGMINVVGPVDHFRAKNCVFYAPGQGGQFDGTVSIDGGGTSHIHNCVVRGGNNGGGIAVGSGATLNVSNTAVFDTSDDFVNLGGASTLNIDFCASDDVDGTNAVDISPGTPETTEWAAAFSDYTTGDLRLSGASSVLHEAGDDLSGHATLPVTVDYLGVSRTTPFDIGAFEESAGGGTTFTQTVTGAISPSGTLQRSVSKQLQGSVDFSGITDLLVKKGITGSLDFTGDLLKRVEKPLAGSLSFSGGLAAQVVFTQLVEGALSFAGALQRKTMKQVSGVLTSSGSLVRSISKQVVGSVSFSGSLVRKVFKALSGAVSFSGALTTIRTFTQSVTGSLSFSGIVNTVLNPVVTAYRKLITSDVLDRNSDTEG